VRSYAQTISYQKIETAGGENETLHAVRRRQALGGSFVCLIAFLELSELGQRCVKFGFEFGHSAFRFYLGTDLIKLGEELSFLLCGCLELRIWRMRKNM